MQSTHSAVQGLAPFGADIAVLVYNPALDGSSPRPSRNMEGTTAAALSGGAASDATGVSAELQHERPELKILTWAHEEVAADALSITGECHLYSIQQCEASLSRMCSAVTAAGAYDRV